jgi:cytochrome c oxidase cbb3-type subunit 3
MMQKSWLVLLKFLSWVVAVQAAEVQLDDRVSAPVVLVMESPYSFEVTVNNLRDAISGNNFLMIREQAWDFGLESGDTSTHETILYFCNFDMVNKAIKLDQRVGQLLPFRITVAERDDSVWVMAINPETFMQMSDKLRLGDFQKYAASMYRQVIEEGLF